MIDKERDTEKRREEQSATDILGGSGEKYRNYRNESDRVSYDTVN